MESNKELFDFMMQKLGGASSVRNEFLKNKIASLNTSSMSVSDLQSEADRDGWGDFFKNMKFTELTHLLVGGGPRPSSAAVRAGKRMTKLEQKDLHKKILDYLSNHPWSHAAEIAQHTGIQTRLMGLRLKDLRVKRLVKTEGEKAQMKYALA